MVNNAIPVEVEEDETTPVPAQTMAELVFGDEDERPCEGCDEGVPHYCGVRWVDEGTVVRLPVSR